LKKEKQEECSAYAVTAKNVLTFRCGLFVDDHYFLIQAREQKMGTAGDNILAQALLTRLTKAKQPVLLGSKSYTD
jgi:hypothetical protein